MQTHTLYTIIRWHSPRNRFPSPFSPESLGCLGFKTQPNHCYLWATITSISRNRLITSKPLMRVTFYTIQEITLLLPLDPTFIPNTWIPYLTKCAQLEPTLMPATQTNKLLIRKFLLWELVKMFGWFFKWEARSTSRMAIYCTANNSTGGKFMANINSNLPRTPIRGTKTPIPGYR